MSESLMALYKYTSPLIAAIIICVLTLGASAEEDDPVAALSETKNFIDKSLLTLPRRLNISHFVTNNGYNPELEKQLRSKLARVGFEFVPVDKAQSQIVLGFSSHSGSLYAYPAVDSNYISIVHVCDHPSIGINGAKMFDCAIKAINFIGLKPRDVPCAASFTISQLEHYDSTPPSTPTASFRPTKKITLHCEAQPRRI